MNHSPTSPCRPSDKVWSIPSCLDAVHDVCAEARQWLEEQGLSHNVFGVDILLRECINNGIIHAHAYDSSKRVHVKLRIGRRCILLRVADQGPGFDWRSTRRRNADDAAASGRGLAITGLYSARVRYNRKGNVITVKIKKEISHG